MRANVPRAIFRMVKKNLSGSFREIATKLERNQKRKLERNLKWKLESKRFV